MSYENNVVISPKIVVSIDAKTYFNISHKVVTETKNCSQFLISGGQEYQPGGVGIYLVVEYFESFWGVN